MYPYLFSIFLFFTHKQSYAGNHFTGNSHSARKIITTAFLVSLICSIFYIVYGIKTVGISLVLISFVLFLLITFIFNKMISKVALRKVLENARLNSIDNMDQDTFGYLFNWQCDVYATITAYVGILVNSVIVIATLIKMFL